MKTWLRSVRSKRILCLTVLILAAFVLQCTLLSTVQLGSVKPNLLLIVVASVGFMRGSREGMITGFCCGLLIDIQFGDTMGFYALIYLLIGFVDGMFEQLYYEEDLKSPLLIIAGSEFVYGIVIYLLRFLLRSEFDFIFYLTHIIIPELLYTMLLTILVYPLLLMINRRLEAEEKRSAGKFV